MTTISHCPPLTTPATNGRRVNRFVAAFQALVSDFGMAFRYRTTSGHTPVRLADLTPEQMNDLGLDEITVADARRQRRRRNQHTAAANRQLFGSNPIADYASYSGLGSPFGR